MQAAEVGQAIAAARSIAAELRLPVDATVVLHNSNKLAVRLRPCDVLARIAPAAHQVAAFEVELAQQLAAAGGPVAALEPRVQPRVYARDGLVVTLWTYYEPRSDRALPAADYAGALARLHAAMRSVTVATPHFTDRVAEAAALLSSRAGSPELGDADRALLSSTLRTTARAIAARTSAEQVLHGEPHPGNVLDPAGGPRFIDLETCCRGPVEFDLAHVPEDVVEHYPNVDHGLLRECRGLVLAMVAAWRWDPADEFPDGEQAGRELVDAVRAGPPWPTLDEVVRKYARPAE